MNEFIKDKVIGDQGSLKLREFIIFCLLNLLLAQSVTPSLWEGWGTGLWPRACVFLEIL